MKRGLLVTCIVLAAASVNSCGRTPTAPSSDPAAIQSSTERRVGGVGGGDAECVEPNPCPPAPPGNFTVTSQTGGTISGEPRQFGFWDVTGGTERFAGAEGTASFYRSVGQTQDQITVFLNFDVPDPAPPYLIEGDLERVATSTQPSTTCSSGVLVTDTFAGVLESLGRVTLELQRCGS